MATRSEYEGQRGEEAGAADRLKAAKREREREREKVRRKDTKCGDGNKRRWTTEEEERQRKTGSVKTGIKQGKRDEE